MKSKYTQRHFVKIIYDLVLKTLFTQQNLPSIRVMANLFAH